VPVDTNYNILHWIVFAGRGKRFGVPMGVYWGSSIGYGATFLVCSRGSCKTGRAWGSLSAPWADCWARKPRWPPPPMSGGVLLC